MPDTRILSLADDNRLEELVALGSVVHTVDEGFMRRMLALSPESNDPSYHRYLSSNGKIVAGTSLIPHTMQWHGTTVRAGEIGLVGTLEERRKQGCCTALMESCIGSMKADGTPISFLWGIPGFYQRFQYHYAFPHTSTGYVSLPKSRVGGWVPTGTIRRAEPADLWWIRKLYRTYNVGLTGCIVRSEELWDWIFRLTMDHDQGKWWITEDPAGGYALVSDKPPKVWEIAAPSESSLKNLVLGIFREYPEIETLDFCHHPDMPIGRWLYRWGAGVSSPEDLWQGTWGGMARVIDLEALLRAMVDKLNARLAGSRFFRHTGEIPIKSEVGSATIKIADGMAKIEPLDGNSAVSLPASVLTPMLTGYRGFVRFRPDFKCIGNETLDLLTILFPRDLVHVSPLLYVDEFFELGE
jgi:predicted acetyltransferase